jgi:hypothetical protein
MSSSFCFLQLTSNSVLFPHSHGTAGVLAAVVLSRFRHLTAFYAHYTCPEIVTPLINTAMA